MQLAANCLQPFATSPPAAAAQDTHATVLLLAHAALQFCSQFFSSYASPVPAPLQLHNRIVVSFKVTLQVLSGDTSPCRALVNSLVAAAASSRSPTNKKIHIPKPVIYSIRWPAQADPIRARALLLLAGVECNAFETTVTTSAKLQKQNPKPLAPEPLQNSEPLTSRSLPPPLLLTNAPAC